MNITRSPCRPAASAPAKTSSRPTAFPVTTSSSSKAGARVPRVTIVDCVFDIISPQYFVACSILSRARYTSWMVIHTFAFRWKPSVTDEQKLRVVQEIRALQGHIPGLVETLVGANISPRSQGYELGGVMKFADRSTFDAYNDHPVHQKLLSWLIPLIDPLEVDFELEGSSD